jgi:hypothetical protein
VRYSDPVATTLDKRKLHDALDQAVIVIDEKDFERSLKDPRARELFKRGEALHAELDAENANR